MLLHFLFQVAVIQPDTAPVAQAEDVDARVAGLTGAEAARAHAQAALAWLDAGDGEKARGAVDRALGQPLPPVVTTELRMLRARADALVGDLVAARADLDLSIAAQPNDIVPLLLSAALARRTGDIERARTDVEAAWDLDPDAPVVLLEAARLAVAAGAPADAAVAWRRVANGTADDSAKEEARAGLISLGLKP